MNGCFNLGTIGSNARFLLQKIDSFNICYRHPSLYDPLTSVQYGALLQLFTSSKSFKKGKQLHAHMLARGVLHENAYLYTKLCALYAIGGKLNEARVIFDEIVLKSTFLWNVMIRGYACNGFPEKAIILYRKMWYFGKSANNFTYPFVLKSCGDLILEQIGKKIHGEVIVSGLASDIYISNSLLAMYLKFKEMDIAQELFEQMTKQDVTSWNTMISGYAKNGNPKKAVSSFVQMGKLSVEMDCTTFVSILPVYAEWKALNQVKEIHSYVIRNCIEASEILLNSLIVAYCGCYFIAGARQLFDRMERKDIFTWNAIISGCTRCKDSLQSFELFRVMCLGTVIPDEITFVGLLGACDQISALTTGRCIHSHLVRRGFMRNRIVGTALIDVYAKCGSLECSIQVFDEMPDRNLISWSAMLSGYSFHGKGKEAIFLLNEMSKNGIKPDEVTFLLILSACSHAGLVETGQKIFYQMESKYSVEPRAEHYTCMVDLLGRAGHLNEAYEFIMNMKIKPNADTWTALLSSCRVHRNVRLAEIAARNAFELDSNRIGLYVSLSNAYALENRWDEVESVRSKARQHGLRKEQGISFIESDKSIHQFLVKDKFHPTA